MSDSVANVEAALPGALSSAITANVLVVDANSEVVWATDQGRELFGLSEGLRDGPPDAPDLHAEGGERTPPGTHPHEIVFETGESLHDVTCHAVVDGDHRLLSVDATPMTDADGHLTNVGLTVEAVAHDEDVAHSTHSSVLKRIDDAFFALDDDWRFTYVNERAETLLERTEAELLERDVWEEFPAAVESSFQEHYEHAMATQKPVSFEAYFSPLEEWFEVHAYPSESGISVQFTAITERKEREHELERYRAIVETIQEGIYVVDDDGYFVEVNEAYESLVGRSREGLIGEHVSTVINDESVLTDAKRLGEELKAGDRETASLVAELSPENGESCIGEATFAVLQSDDGDERIGVVRDITDRLERERRLQRQRERLDTQNEINALVQSVAESVIQRTSSRDIRTTVEEQMMDSRLYDSVWTGRINADRDAVRATDGADGLIDGPIDITAVDDTKPLTVRAVRSDEMDVKRDLTDAEGSWAEAALSEGYRGAAAIPISSKSVTYGVLTVYTSREGAFEEDERLALERLGTIIAEAIRSANRESQLRQSEQRYRTIAENIPGAVSMVDTDLSYSAVAGNAFNRIDIDPRDLRGKRPTEVDALPDHLAERLESLFRDALNGEEFSTQTEYQDRVFDAEGVPLRGDDNEIVAAMMLSRDITDRIEHRRKLEYERERLEFLIRLIRHNLLNSLNVVDARLDFLQGRVDDEVVSHLDTARNRTTKMIDLVETIRQLTSAMAEDAETRLRPVPADEVVTEQVESAAVTFPNAEFDLEGVPSVSVLADGLLEEAIENVLHNAVQHNDKPTPLVSVTSTVDDGWVTISVADNGPGLPDDVKRHLFEEGNATFDDPSSGFGLYLVREIVDSYGGEFTVTDGNGGGAMFHLKLPRSDTPA